MENVTEPRFELIKNNFVDVRNPTDKYRIIRLYQIVSLYEFTNAVTGTVIKKHSLGGYVERIDCMEHNDTSWVDNTAKVFGNAKLYKGSFIQNDAVVYDNAHIDSSIIKDKAHVFGDAFIMNSTISGNADVRDKAVVISGSLITNSSIVFGSARVENTIMTGAAICRDNAYVACSTLNDVSEVKNNAIVKNCVLNGRTIIGQDLSDATRNEDVELNVINGKD